MPRLSSGPKAFRNLNGIFCVYKQTGLSAKSITQKLKFNLVRDLNALPCYKHELELGTFQRASVRPTDHVTAPVSTNVPAHMSDLTEHRLVLGERFIEEDINLKYLHGIPAQGSGVLVFGVGGWGVSLLGQLALSKFMRVYHVKGRFGYATDNFFPDGKFIERTTYHHITKEKLDKVCGAAQSGHQRLMFQYAGVDANSQEAYEMASSGIIRPSSSHTPPLLYSVRCVDFTPPDFMLEVHCINERGPYLAELIHDIGLKLKSTAVCSHIRRIRYGHFTLEHTLLRKDWNLEPIIHNINQCRHLVTPKKLLTDIAFNQSQRLESGKVAGESEEETGAEELIKSIVHAKKAGS